MVSTWHFSTTSPLLYCSVHQRAWVESRGQWVAFPAPKMYGSPVMEAVCDTCMTCVLRTFQAQFPDLYASGESCATGPAAACVRG